MTIGRGLGSLLMMGACGLVSASACRRDTSGPVAEDSSAPTVVLAGEFERVAKSAQGRAEIVRRGDQFELRLRQVRVDSKRPVRVYLVGVDRAPTTRSVASAELKYDMATLDQTVAEQIIALPSEPDPRIRSVVLWEPTFYVNLAFAPLRPPGGEAEH